MYDGQYLDDMHKITVGEVWRLQGRDPDSCAWIYDGDKMNEQGGDPLEYRTTVFRIESITDGRGRFYGCDGKLTVEDVAFGVQEFPLVWRQSNLNRSGFWVLVGVNCYGRTLYRTRHGWRMAVQIREDGNGALYKEQAKSRERRKGRGMVGSWEHLFSRAAFADNWEDEHRNRKLTYRGKPTPFLRRTVKTMRKYGFSIPQPVRALFE